MSDFKLKYFLRIIINLNNNYFSIITVTLLRDLI